VTRLLCNWCDHEELAIVKPQQTVNWHWLGDITAMCNGMHAMHAVSQAPLAGGGPYDYYQVHPYLQVVSTLMPLHSSSLTDMFGCRWEGTSQQHSSAEHVWPYVGLHQCPQELAKLTCLSGLTLVYCCRWQEPNEKFRCSECLWSHFRLHQCA